ncbi:MAG: DnaD domain protein [Clostridia bacterium]|nr:DnaD domain protein [Clostridia bacterium]
MGFCEFSNEKITKNNIELSNFFVTDYMIGADELQLKFYLYGLYLCQNPNIPENGIDAFCKKFELNDRNDVLAIFSYWEEVGLIKIISVGDDYMLKYLPISKYGKIEKDISKGKYSKFCSTVQEFITGRQLLPNEYYEFIDFLDYSHMEQDALLAIVNYAVTLKGANVGYKYILAIAKSWYYKGILTEKAVLEQIEQINSFDDNLVLVMKEFGKSKKIGFEEKEMWEIFTKKWNFEFNFIINIAKDLKKKKKGNFDALKDKLEKYYKMNLRTLQEVEEYETLLETYKQTAMNINQQLGLYYENLTPIIDHYIVNWFNNGYDRETLVAIASYCFKNNIRTLDGMNSIIEKFVKLGLISLTAINDYINELITLDKKIKVILEKLLITRKVNHFDRDFYKIWTYKYNYGEDIIDYAITKAQGKFQPMQYLNKILSTYYDKNVKSVEDAKKVDSEIIPQTTTSSVVNKSTTTTNKQNNVVITHSYTKEELNSFFTNLDDIEF